MTDLKNVTLDNANGTALQNDLELDGALTLTDGALSIATNTMTLNGLISGGSGSLTGGSSSNIVFGGTDASTDLPAVSLNDLTINRSNGIGLAGDVFIEGALTLTTGDLDLSGHTLTLGATATLVETDGNTVKGDAGAITTTRTFNAGDLSGGQNIAGMGAEVTTDAGLGQTTISRGHSAQSAIASTILRYYDISPANNSGLAATLVFHYDDSELNGLTESGLELLRSEDSGSTWSAEGGTVDTDNETITLGGIDALSRWTASELGFHRTVSLTGVDNCSVAWGDYDNDGDLDVLMAGNAGGSGRITRIYRNDGGSFTSYIALGGVSICSVRWGDYDNDGDLDVLLAGQAESSIITRIYRNDGSDIFTDIGAGLRGVLACSVAWGDYDNDGDLDLLLAGDSYSGSITRIYRNEGSGTFNDISAGLPGVNDCSVAWGDYDNDGDLDVILAGRGPSSITRIYRNEGSGTFNDISAGLPGLYYCSVAWGDYDNDGDLDVLLAGRAGSIIISVYRNEGSGTFTDIGAGLPGVYNCSVAWGDYDNDGDLDMIIAGYTGSSHVTRIYRNEGADTFTQADSLTGVRGGSVAWGDYDNDGDLDVLLAGDTGSSRITRIYRNDGLSANTLPVAPSNLAASLSDQEVTLSWDKSTDAETAADALTYNLRIGTSSGGVEVMSPMADAATGWRRVPALGNTNHDATWVVEELASGTYYWSVQAIDNAFAGSAFAAEGTFGIIGITTASVTDITKTTATCGGDVTHEGGSSVTAKGVVWDTTEDPTVGSHLDITNDGSGPGSFTSSLTGLSSGQTYYVRAYAINSEGTNYGETRVFAPNMTPPGDALEFDGTDDYANVGSDSSFNVGNTLTIEAWVKPANISARYGIFSGRFDDGTGRFQLEIGAGTNRVAVTSPGTYVAQTNDNAIVPNEWSHIAYTRSGTGSGTHKIYVNGVSQTLISDADYTFIDNSSDKVIGCGDSGGQLFPGGIDEVRIWNRARSESAIQDSMNIVLEGDEAGLVAYYRFDHLSGTVLSDLTTNDNDGMLMNMEDADWVLSAASVGHHSHVGLGTSNLVENTDVPVDITWDADPGTDAIFAAIQVDDYPDVTTGLPSTFYDSTYSELWIAHDDGSWQTDAAFHYDNLSGIWDETTLALYTRTAPGQSWSLVSGTTTDYEGSTSDGIGSITANDLTGFSQFIVAGGNEMTLTGTVQLDTLVLEWSTVPPASSYWVYGAFNEPYFDPQAESPFGYRLTVTADTTWSSPAGIADPDTNWTYQVLAVDGSDTELGRTNRFGEHDFLLP